jgi:ribonuclease P protein component
MRNNFSFPKKEKLVSRKLIDRLFVGGGSKSMSCFPLRLVFMVLDHNDEAMENNGSNTEVADAQMLVSVPKRCFKHAVDRNRVKRQVREAYRRHRDLYEIPEGKYLAMAFIWLDHQHHDSAEVEEKVVGLLRRLGEKLAK